MEKDQGFEYKDGASIEQKKEPTEYERGYRQAMDDTWKWFAKGFPRDISSYIEGSYKNVMERNLKDK